MALSNMPFSAVLILLDAVGEFAQSHCGSNLQRIRITTSRIHDQARTCTLIKEDSVYPAHFGGELMQGYLPDSPN